MHLILKVYQSNFHLSRPKLNTFFISLSLLIPYQVLCNQVFFFSSASKILVHRIGIVRSRSVNEHWRCLLTYLPVVAHATGERKGIAKQTNRWKATFWFRKYIHYMTAYIYEGLNCILPLIYHTEILPYLHAKCIQETRLKLLPIWGEIGKWIFTACPWIKK